jgi:predicted phosphodiesterase
MKDIGNISLSMQMNPRLLYKIVALASCCYLIMLSFLFSAHIVLAQEEDDSPKTTKKPSKTNFNFAAAGDWGCTDDTTNTVNNMVDKKPELVLALGDFSYEPTADCWLDVIQPIDNTIDNAMKIVIGNHDVEDLQNYMDHFGLAREYYSFDIKNVHFIALGTEEEYLDFSNDIAKEQLAFVKSDLEKASTNPDIDWIIPFFHRLMYYDDNGQCDNLVDEYDHNLVDVYHPLFEKYGVSLVLHGHAHTYERSYPLKFNFGNSEQPIVTSEDPSNYRSEDGLVIATVGTGGSKFTETCLLPELAAVQYANLFGFLNVDVSSDGTKLVGTFYDNADGEIKDTFTITK